MAKYTMNCEYCGEEYTAARKHSRTCSGSCRYKLYKGGFSNKKVMELMIIIPNCKDATRWLKAAPEGHYNYCTEESGMCAIYRYNDDYVKANPNAFTNCKGRPC